MRLFPHTPLEAGGVIAEQGMLPDDVADNVGLAVQQFNSISSWTGEKRRLREELDALCAHEGYVGFEADPRDYAVHRVGQSFLYDVPEGKRGRLAKFCGKRVRIVCLWSGKYRRFIRVGAVEPNRSIAGRWEDAEQMPIPVFVPRSASPSSRGG